MSKHTPGPWRWSGEPGASNLTAQNGKDVFAYAEYENIFPAIFKPEEDAANMRLIAAAPELLEALKECSDRLRIHMKHTEDLMAHMKAQKAIAKAEGRE